MESGVVLDWAILAAIGLVSALAAMAWMAPRRHPRPAGASFRDLPAGETVVLLYDGSDLIDATDAARRRGDIASGGADWSSMRATLSDRFPGLPANPDDIRTRGGVVVAASAPEDDADILCEWIDGITRVQLRDRRARPRDRPADPELDMLRHAMAKTPYPVWYVDSRGQVGWTNAAYDTLCEKVFGDDKSGPDRAPLFPSAAGPGAASRKSRTGLTISGGNQKLWFDVSVREQGGGSWCFATDINAVVDAEIAQRNFVQTLAKTFAQLSIGLAIFDRNRQLALFNPALIDLTSLPADFLSARPTLLSFFDRLRDQRMMPEPKNYESWRHQMADLVAAAADGRYQETWSLPSGSVYSVTGRPHPDGAVAFLIEDITAEITLTRRFRTDLEIQQSVLEQLDQAIAVFSDSGGLILTNAAYRRLWRVDPEAGFVQMTVIDAVRSWQVLCDASPVFGEIRDFVATRDGRVEWWAPLRLKSGDRLACTVCPVHNGATMVAFENAAPSAPDNRKVAAPVKIPALPGG